VLYVVFTHIIRFGAGVKDYPVYLLSSLVLFSFFSDTTSQGVTSLVDRENLLRKIHFPRLVIPLAVALHAMFNLGLNLVAVFVFVFASGIAPRVEWLEILVLIPMLAIFATGVAMLLSALYVRFRDFEPIWEVALQLLFYGSPVLYVITAVPESVRELMAMNPIATVLTQWRHAVIDADAPTASAVVGGWDAMLVPIAIVAAVFAIGFWVFARETPRIAENL
jgi:ABC-2 type transport system permease protein